MYFSLLRYLDNKSVYIKNWKYYNHAVIPDTPPHELPDLTPLKDGSIWNIDGKFPLFARYTTDFDCPKETDWYYLIKDTLYEPNLLDRKKRYNINRGRKNFEVKIIKPKEYLNELADVIDNSFKCYPTQYKPNFNKLDFIKKIKNGIWDNYIVFAAFDKTSGKIGGITLIKIQSNQIVTIQQKATEWAEKNRVNYALVDGYLTHFNNLLKEGYYINGGGKNLVHLTNWHEIKINYFGFRKIFCKLNIVYRPIIKPIVFILYLFRRSINSLKNKSPLLYKINAVLEMESIARKCRAMK